MGLLERRPDQQAEHDREQRRALDERRQNQRARLNRSRDFRLARHAFGGRAADATDPDARANRGEAGTDPGAEERERTRVLLGIARRRGLEERKKCHVLSLSEEL